MYYSATNLLSRGCLFNFAVGSRGCGKSYDGKKRMITKYLKTGKQSVYLRRYDTELKLVKDTVFNDIIINNEYNNAITIDGRSCLIDGKQAIHMMDLNGSYKVKSQSFPEVDLIVFDEFLIKKGLGRYIQNECEQFLEFYETIARMRRVPVLFLGNATSLNNPYFDYFNIMPQRGSRFTRKGEVCIELCESDEFIKAKENTAFGQLISGTRYGEYAIQNRFLHDSYEFICPMSGHGQYCFTVFYKGEALAVYWQSSKGIYHINHSVDNNYPIRFSFSTEDHKPNMILFQQAKKNPAIANLQYAFDMALVQFDNIKTKNIIYELFDYL